MRPTVETPPKTPWMILRRSRMWRLDVKPIKKKSIVCVKRPLMKSALGLKREVNTPQKVAPNVMTMLEDPIIHPTHNRVSLGEYGLIPETKKGKMTITKLAEKAIPNCERDIKKRFRFLIWPIEVNHANDRLGYIIF
jgi:hypothetical protein